MSPSGVGLTALTGGEHPNSGREFRWHVHHRFAVGEYVTPELLGGPSSLMIGRILWGEFFSNRDWPTASAVAIAVLLALVVPLMIYQKYQDKELEKES